MPYYVYKCPEGHERTVLHKMSYEGDIGCNLCARKMHRVPQPFRVNWGGPAPSQWEIDPALKEHADNLDRGQAEYQEYKEKYYENRRNVLGSDEV